LAARWSRFARRITPRRVIGVNSFYFKLVAFATSSFIGGVTGAILIGTFYHAVTPEQFSVDVSIQALAMVIVGLAASSAAISAPRSFF